MKMFDKSYKKVIREVSGEVAEAYFISPTGKAIPVRDGRHINTIIKYASSFGTSKAEIEKIHRKHGESLNTEGYARNEVFLNLMKKGYVRVRYYPRNMLIQMQVFKLTPKMRENIWGFLTMAEKGEIKFPTDYIKNTDVCIVDTDGNYLYRDGIREVRKQLFKESGGKYTRLPVIVEAYDL